MIAARPTPGQPADWSFPEAGEHRLDNGLRVLLYDRPGQHVTSTRLVVPAPLAVEPRDREGIGTIVARTMDEGTQEHTADELAALFERDGIALGAGYGARGMILELEAVASRSARGWELLSECVSTPVFPEQDVARHVRQRLAEYEHESASPRGWAALEFAASFYAPESRASRPAGGRPDTVRPIETADAARFHERWIRPDGSTVVVAGDLDAADTLTHLNSTLGQWRTAEPLSVPQHVAAVVAPGAPRIVFVDRPGAVQTELLIGSFGPDRNDALGWAPYPAIGFLVGGSPNARLDAVLREEKGYTYGFRAGFRPRTVGGTFVGSGSVRGDATVDATDIALQVLDDVAVTGFTEAETRSAVDYLGKTSPARYATADVVADEAASLALDGLSTQFVTDYLRQLAGLQPADLDRAWAAWSDQPRTIVLVGDAEKYADGIRGLGRGEVTVV